MKKVLLVLVAALTIVSCTTVDSGHKGVEVSWGGETNMSLVHPEGMNGGFHWIFDNMIQYDVREKTMVEKFEFNDKNNMLTGVEIALDYNLNPSKVNQLHVGINDYETKILKTLKSTAKEVVPQYSAIELNITKRNEAEEKLAKILSEELPEFFIEFARVQMTDVDIPMAVSALAEQTAKQIGKNELATKMKAEKESLAEAQIAEAKGKFEAAEFDFKRKELLSDPKLLKLKQIEVDMQWAKKGVSKYGNNNMFGVQGASVIKGL